MNEELTYEQALERLEEIVKTLENSETTLDESLKLFEEGTKLASYCNDKLINANQKITEISKD